MEIGGLLEIMLTFLYNAKYFKGENPDFLKLIEVRKLVAEELNLDEHQLELSMGMSNDYAEAIK